MKKTIFLGLSLLLPFQAFCYLDTRTCNGFDVQNQIVSLQQWGCRIQDVRCYNRYAPLNDQRWEITYDTQGR